MCRYCEEYRTDLPVICSEIDIKVNVGNQVPILEMYVIDNNGNDYAHDCKINYCPMCGRKLNEEEA